MKMKSHFWMVQAAALGALALQTACAATGETSSPPVAQEPQDTVITVRGTNTDGVTSAPVVVGGVEVTADGRSVEAVAESAAIDLADTEGRVAARFSVPAGAEQVTVHLALDDYGGYETATGQAGALDTRGTSLTFEVPARDLAENGRVEIAVDLSESLVSTGSETMRLVPHLSITY
jgi:hypothetical protein